MTIPDLSKQRGTRAPPEWLVAAAFIVFLALSAVILVAGGLDPHGMIGDEFFANLSFSAHFRPLGLVLAASVPMIALFAWRERTGPAETDAAPRSLWRSRTCIGFILVGTSAAFAAVLILRTFPNSGDEYDYLFQAQTFLHGRLWNALPPAPDFFQFHHILQKDGKWVTQYPPGWPVILAVGHFGGLPYWAICPLLGGALLVAVATFCAAEGGLPCAILGLALMAPTPFLLFNAGSYFSEVSTALFGLLFCYLGVRFLDAGAWGDALLAGAALGIVGLIRPFAAVTFALPFLAEWLWRKNRPPFPRLAAIGAGGVPMFVAFVLYNRAVTGDALLPVQQWAYPLQRFGFPPVNEIGTPMPAIRQFGLVIVRFIALIEWTSPLFAVAAYGMGLAWLGDLRKARFYDLILPTTVIAFLFYAEFGGNQYGPRYYFEAYPLLVVTTSRLLVGLVARSPDGWLGPVIRGTAACHAGICFVSFLVIALFERTIIDQRMDLYDAAQRMHLENAVVLVRSHTGAIHDMDPLDLVRDGLSPDGSVVYALYLPARFGELEAAFPGRRFYVYERAPGQVKGTIDPFDPASQP